MPEDLAAEKSARRDRFVRVAARRTQQILEDIDRLAKCSNKAGYQYSQADVVKIFGAIDGAITRARAGFEPKRKEVETFSLDD